MTSEQMPHRLAGQIHAGSLTIEQVPGALRIAVEYQLGLLIGASRAAALDPRKGLAEQGSRMADFEQLSETTKRGVRLGLRRAFFHRRHQIRHALRANR